MTMTNKTETRAGMLNDALRHLRSGLELLDEASAPGQIGANVDLAIHQLTRAIAAIVEEVESA